MAVIESKRCPRCMRVLCASKFHRDASKRDGLRSYCKKCHSVTPERELVLPPVPPEAVLAINNWRGAQPGQLQGRAW